MTEATNAAEPGMHWSIDKRVPLALVWTVGIGVVLAIVFCTTWYIQSNALGERVTRLESTSAVTAAATAESMRLMQIDVARISERVAFLVEHEQREENRGKP